MLAEPGVEGKAQHMRQALLIFALTGLALVAPGCRQQEQGPPQVIVIGPAPRLSDPARGPLSKPDAVLLANVAQGLVRFDGGGNVVSGIAERWNVSDDGLSYIFRLAATNWPDGRKLTAEQVARILKRATGPRSQNSLKDTLGAVEDIVAMTDRVIEIRLASPRPNLLALLAQPEMAILRNGEGTGPFSATAEGKSGTLRLTRKVIAPDDEPTQQEAVLLGGAPVEKAVRSFASGHADLVLGGTFVDLSVARSVKMPRGALQFDPASGLFGLIPARSGGEFDSPDARHLLSEAIDRDLFLAALAVPGLSPRVTVLEPGLEGIAAPTVPAWTASPLAERLEALRNRANTLFPAAQKPTIRISLPEGAGAELLLRALVRSWGALGFPVERAPQGAPADFRLIDEVAPSSSPAWFLRAFHCGATPVCDAEIDTILDAARQTVVPQQRSALLQQAGAAIDDEQLFIPITAPVRWSLVGRRVPGFAGNRFAVHTLTGLQQRSGSGD